MIGSLIAILSLNMSLSLIQNYGQVAGTIPVTNATVTTPIVITSPNHGIPLSRVLHGIVSGVTGTIEANGLWEMTPLDANTLSLASYTAQGISQPSVGVNAYASGGVIQYAFPDYQILLGRQMLALSTAVVSPRIVFIPTNGRAWIYESYGSVGITGQEQRTRGDAEQQSMTQEKLYATQLMTFEVYVSGAANPPSPNFGDFDATQLIVYALYQRLFEDFTPDIAQVLQESWPSQLDPNNPQATGSNTQRGQQWKGIVQIKLPVAALPKSFVPAGTSIVMSVYPVDPAAGDTTTIDIPGVS